MLPAPTTARVYAGRASCDTGVVTRPDPDVELLADAPVVRPSDDLLARAPIAARLVELACAQPHAAPRAVALVGDAGAGKTSVLNLAAALLTDRPDVVHVTLDAAGYAGAEPLVGALQAHLIDVFSAAGVVDATDAVRDTLAGYGELVSGIARIAGVRVDVGGVLRRSAEDVRDEIAEMTHEVGKRVAIVVDHVDRLPVAALASTLEALRHYAAIPYVTIVLALDRRETARRLARAELDRGLLERLLPVELALPPADRVLLARVLAGGLARAGERVGVAIDPILPLVDPDAPDALVLDLVETPRDAKRAINALAAALPLVPDGADLHRAALELVLRLLVPELDVPRLAARRDELESLLRGHRREQPARAALAALV